MKWMHFHTTQYKPSQQLQPHSPIILFSLNLMLGFLPLLTQLLSPLHHGWSNMKTPIYNKIILVTHVRNMINTQSISRGRAYSVDQAFKPNPELPLKNIKIANFQEPQPNIIVRYLSFS
jgi:hypothetical protein